MHTYIHANIHKYISMYTNTYTPRQFTELAILIIDSRACVKSVRCGPHMDSRLQDVKLSG